MKILVTGSAGLIGSHLADELTKMKYDVIGVDNLSGGHIRNTRNHKFHLCDLRDKFATEALVSFFKVPGWGYFNTGIKFTGLINIAIMWYILLIVRF